MDKPTIADANILIESFYKAKVGSAFKESVQRYEMNLWTETLSLYTELSSGTYEQMPFYEFDIHERGKARHIKAMHIRDRVVQRALCDHVLIPAIRPLLIYDNGASLKGKGIDFARKRFEVHLREHLEAYGDDGYILLIDFKGFFDSIPHGRLLATIKPLISPADYALVEQMIRSFSEDGISLGIGSQISQICGIYYPTPIDNYCKIVEGIRGYGRYMDDIYVIHQDKAYLLYVLENVTRIAEGLGLHVHPRKTQIVKLAHGFTWLQTKYHIKDGRITRSLCRQRIVRRRRKLKKFALMVKDGRLAKSDIDTQQRAWVRSLKRYKCKHSIESMDLLYRQLFKEG